MHLVAALVAFLALTLSATVPSPFAATNLSTLQPGEWYEIPNSALSASGVYPPNPVPPGDTGPSAIMDAWSGGAYDTNRDHFLIHGGGHSDYAGNEIYAFDLNGLTWSRLWGPSSNIPPYTDTYPDTYPDGNPVAVHTYSGLVYLPTQDAMWRGGGSAWSSSGGGTRAAWSFGFASNSWRRLAGSPSLGVSQCSAYDSVTGHVFGFSDQYTLSEYDPGADKWTDKTSVGGTAVGEEMTCVIDPVARVLVAIGNGDVLVYNLQTNAIQNKTTTGAPSVVDMRGPALTYDSAIKKIVGWAGGTSVYSLDTSSWTWTQYSAAGTNSVTPSTPTQVGVFSRFQYVPSRNLYLVVNSVDTSVYAYKLSSGGGSPSLPPPPSGGSPSPPPPPSGTYLFEYSLTADRSSPQPLDKASLSGTAYIFLVPPDASKVTSVTFSIDGTQVTVERLTPYDLGETAPDGTSGPYNVSQLTAGSHTFTARVLNSDNSTATLSAAVTVTGTPLSPPPPSPPPPYSPPPSPPSPPSVLPGQIDLPVKQWVAVPTPTLFDGGAKHVVGSWNPDNGRIYFTGGDHNGFGDSYRQDTWSLSLADRWADKSNPAAGLTQEYPDCGPSGQVQPKHPDFMGWSWDANRHKFWLAPGEIVASDTNCTGETSSQASDPGFLWDRVMTFDPATRQWADAGPGNYHAGDQWGSVYDPVTDSIIRFYGYATASVETFSVAQGVWTATQTFPAGYIDRGAIAPATDFQGRVIYTIDPYGAKLYRYHIDARTLDDLGAIPGGPLVDLWQQPTIVWDPIDNVLLWARHPDATVFPNGDFQAYHPDTRTWEKLPTTTNIPGVTAAGLIMAYDQGQNAVVLISRDPSGNTSTYYMSVFRYSGAP